MKQCSIVMMNFPFEKTMTSYSLVDQCEKEFKRLKKKYRTLSEDMERFCKFTLKLEEDGDFPAANKNYTLLKQAGNISIFKARMACAALRGNKFRVVYARHAGKIEFIFIEMYTKNERERENQSRITEYLSAYRE